eukprot:1155418-Pelagomonas_calceolata.AAC.6
MPPHRAGKSCCVEAQWTGMGHRSNMDFKGNRMTITCKWMLGKGCGKGCSLLTTGLLFALARAAGKGLWERALGMLSLREVAACDAVSSADVKVQPLKVFTWRHGLPFNWASQDCVLPGRLRMQPSQEDTFSYFNSIK